MAVFAVFPEYVKNLYIQQQNGINTDCSFVFEVESENGEIEKKIIHAHKTVLSAVSQFFENHFKPEWVKNQPIPITSCEHNIFEKLITAIYLGVVTFKNLEEACNLYEAAHFYCIEETLNLLREKMMHRLAEQDVLFIKLSSVLNLSFKYGDDKLKKFSVAAFTENAHNIIDDPDFLHYSTEVINFLYQIDDLAANEFKLLKILEKYVEDTKVDKAKVQPAINAIRFLSLGDSYINSTSLLSDIEKLLLQNKVILNVSHNKEMRKGPNVFTFR